jgi:polyisoprenoid-binding protein YceI
MIMKRALSILSFLALPGAVAAAQSTARLAVGADSRLWIEGASNVSRWNCKATTLDAAIEVDSGFKDVNDLPTYLRSVRVKVPVAALRCGHDQMDKSLRKALRADEASAGGDIVASFEAVKEDTTPGVVRTVGTLTLAGRENTVTMNIDAAPSADGTIEARGELSISMSDFGITPPTAMLGVVRCANRVLVKFALRIAPMTATLPAQP